MDKTKNINRASKRHKGIDEEVDKLLNVRFIYEIEYPEWLANMVLAKKANEKWRMCVNYIDLIEVFPKDF